MRIKQNTQLNSSTHSRFAHVRNARRVSTFSVLFMLKRRLGRFTAIVRSDKPDLKNYALMFA